MLVAVISDVHNNEVNLKKVLDYCKSNKIEKIVCCGDLASDETLYFMADNFNPPSGGEIFYVFGNMDNGQLQEFKNVESYKNVKLFADFGEAEIDGKKIAFVHFPEVAKRLAETGKYNFVFYGHTHKPWTASVKTSASQGISECVMLNPGNVAGEYYLPTFATWDTDGDLFQLIKVHDLN